MTGALPIDVGAPLMIANRDQWIDVDLDHVLALPVSQRAAAGHRAR